VHSIKFFPKLAINSLRENVQNSLPFQKPTKTHSVYLQKAQKVASINDYNIGFSTWNSPFTLDVGTNLIVYLILLHLSTWVLTANYNIVEMFWLTTKVKAMSKQTFRGRAKKCWQSHYLDNFRSPMTGHPSNLQHNEWKIWQWWHICIRTNEYQ
jgi:hypothetical protein